MDRRYRCCCGLDVHRDTVVACVLQTDAAAERGKQVRTFATTSEGLTALVAWLQATGCEQAAMEATGVYWKPVFNMLDGRIAILVANAAHIKAVPGRKTDVKDAEWIAQLLQHGLLRPSFIPGREQRELRDLTRTRTTLIDERSAVVNRLHKVLEDANLKLNGVVSDVLGVSGRAMIEAILAGTTEPAALAELAKGRLRTKRDALERALAGRVTDHHRLLLTAHLTHIDFLNASIAHLSAAIADRLAPAAEELAWLDTIPGVGRPTAEVLLAEIGSDVARFPTPGHLASWAGMCPGNHRSAGKQRRGTTRKGSRFLRRALCEAAWAAVRKRGCSLGARYRRLVVRRGPKRAIVAVGHTILVLAYHLLQRREADREPEPERIDQRRRARLRQRALDQLRGLGYDVTLAPTQPAA
jgi:transposase